MSRSDEIADSHRHAWESRVMALETLRRTVAAAEALVEQNRALAEFPEHREDALRRVEEGEQELRDLANRIAAMEEAFAQDERPLGS